MQAHSFTLRSRPDSCPLPCGDFEIEIDVAGNYTLRNLGEILVQAIGFECDHAFGFYPNIDEPYQSDVAYTLFADLGEGQDHERPISKTSVTEIFAPETQMVLLFDYGDGWEFLVTCTAVEESKLPAKGFRITATTGELPIQYPDCDG
jgi:hypothetical protein